MKPTDTALDNAQYFKSKSIVAAYRHRAPYPPATFDFLETLLADQPKRVLDVGCGAGELARRFIDRVDQIDAVDFSNYMIEAGKRLPNGDHPMLHWIHGKIEEVPLAPPYGLIMAGASFHWLDWSVVMPLFNDLLVPGGYLAILAANSTPHPWEMLGDVVSKYRSDGGFEPRDIFAELEEQGYFEQIGEHRTEPLRFEQTIGDYVESYHSRPGFSRERMGEERAAAFGREARSALAAKFTDGVVNLEVIGHIIWGLPNRGK